VVSTLIRVTGDWSLAEDCTAEAFEAALATWPRDGIPHNPGAWLTTVAKNRALDRLRRAATLARKLEEVAAMSELEQLDPDMPAFTDDRLRLVFTCCHPALSLEARVALTLRTVGGLTTAQIARAFLVPEPTIAQRIVRAKRKITEAGIPYRVPEGELLVERLTGVLAVLYLVFNEGYSVIANGEIADEAIRLTRALDHLMPGEPEVLGLLALMLLQHSRRHARSRDGAIVTLEEQDRSLWDAAAIAEAGELLGRAGRRARPGPYQLQAAIASVHATASEPDNTDWPSIVALYDRLLAVTPSPIVELNRAVAVGMASGPEVGLAVLERVAASGALDGYYLLPAARADLFRRLGDYSKAADFYRVALAGAPTQPERDFFARRLDEVGS
jgi:RNA polymerase sigma-70 factor, ECF subfamily